ncbi:MAG TPA: DNA/RNA helicase domain-containing protein, partial [Planctomycetota bacterium]|nr:DNA/RNA helicase domain-containing protein [Planctomycetota bacterium]
MAKSPNVILDTLASQSAQIGFPPLQTQIQAWHWQIQLLKGVLANREGAIYFEYSIPRMGRRIDTVLLLGPVIFVIEFKVGEKRHNAQAYDQVWDYALDLKNFHSTSHKRPIVPLLIPSEAGTSNVELVETHGDRVYLPIKTTPASLGAAIETTLKEVTGPTIDPSEWELGRYQPTPTIIEAARALYSTHSVVDIARNEADKENLNLTSNTLHEIITSSRQRSQKTICFVTGVPGAGKTLVGLKVATEFMDPKNQLHAVYLSGNGPLVKVLCEALARDKRDREKARGRRVRITKARTEAKAFIQNVHHFRDECLQDDEPPTEHVTLFDEAQRAWDLKTTSQFMKQKKGLPDFHISEPEFLISCLDRHQDWAVIICLVGGGQEINRGEAGISEWVRALKQKYPEWRVCVSKELTGSEYGSGIVQQLASLR